jgi:hypothetical protein
MDKTEFDVLCEGANAEETRLLSKLLKEWCRGDERSFPVHLALLTRAQWRAAASVPLLVTKSREQLAADFIQHRRDISQMVSGFQQVIQGKLKTVEAVVTTHDQNTGSTLADMRSVLNRTATIGDQIKADLYQGRKSWEQARADFETERQKMEQSRKELDSRQNWRDWLVFGGLVFAVLLLGMAIGLLLRK